MWRSRLFNYSLTAHYGCIKYYKAVIWQSYQLNYAERKSKLTTWRHVFTVFYRSCLFLSRTPAKWFIVEDHEFHCRFVFLRLLFLSSFQKHSRLFTTNLENSVCLLLSRCVSSSWRFFCARSTHKNNENVKKFSSRGLSRNIFLLEVNERTLCDYQCNFAHKLTRWDVNFMLVFNPHRTFSLSLSLLNTDQSLDDDVKF